jgi:hypothetical protein
VIISAMDGRLPLPTLLSQALVAFTIEFDKQSERQMRHRTTRDGSAGSLHAPWLLSPMTWPNCMRFVEEDGLPVGELKRRARTTTNLAGMQRWGYITIEKDPPIGGLSRPAPLGWFGPRPLVARLGKYGSH